MRGAPTPRPSLLTSSAHDQLPAAVAPRQRAATAAHSNWPGMSDRQFFIIVHAELRGALQPSRAALILRPGMTWHDLMVHYTGVAP